MKHRIRVGRPVGRPVWAYVAALCLGASAAVASCYNGDQSCGEAYNPNDLGDHCPYGPPGGPKPGDFPSDCPTIEKLPAAECAGVTWPAVYALLLSPQSGNCTSGGKACHTNQIGDIAPFVDPVTPEDGGKAFLDALAKFNGSFGNAYPTIKDNNAVARLYYDRESPELSWWLCNLQGDAGSLMPSGKPRMTEADVLLLEQWLACGAGDDPGR
jgi:hypothetical protein